MATAEETGTTTKGALATLMNLITSIAFTNPIISEPESPMNILAG